MGPGIVVSAGPPSRIQRGGGSVIVGASGQITAQATAGQAIQLSANGATFSVTAAGAITIAPLAGQSTTISNGQLLMPNGTALLPSVSGTGGSFNTSGLYWPEANVMGIVGATTEMIRLNGGSGNIIFDGRYSIGWSAGPVSSTPDLTITRDAADVFSQRRTTTAQQWRVSNTWTSATNLEYFAVDWQTAANVCLVGTVKGSGGGTARTLSLMTDATSRVTIHATTGLMDALYGVNVPTGQAYTYNGVNVVRAQTALFNYYTGPAGNLTGTGSYNTGAGYLTMNGLTNGAQNTAFGSNALPAVTSGGLNTGIGQSTLVHVTTSSGNSAFGAGAGFNNGVPLITISNCTFLGYQANSSVNAITNSTAIGNGAQVTASNQVVIGNASIANTKIMAGNLIVATGVVGTSGVGVLALGNGTVPSTSPADCAQLFSVDIAAGRATLGIRTEEAVAVDIALSSTTSYVVNINGANYKMLLVAV